MTDVGADLAALVAKAQTGDHQSMSLIFEQMKDRIFRFFDIRTKDRDLAEDLTQTTFVEMIHALPRYRVQSNAKFTTWLFQIARHRLIDHYRQSGRTVELEAAEKLADSKQDHHDPIERDLVLVATRQLPESYQTVLHLMYQEDLDTKDIAEILKTNVVNVRVLHHRALKALRKLLPKETV
jgi:RNA polymerase sigma-70 factor (ECF subfamily)